MKVQVKMFSKLGCGDVEMKVSSENPLDMRKEFNDMAWVLR